MLVTFYIKQLTYDVEFWKKRPHYHRGMLLLKIFFILFYFLIRCFFKDVYVFSHGLRLQNHFSPFIFFYVCLLVCRMRYFPSGPALVTWCSWSVFRFGIQTADLTFAQIWEEMSPGITKRHGTKQSFIPNNVLEHVIQESMFLPFFFFLRRGLQ